MVLHGNATTTTSTAIGILNLQSIPFSVTSTLLGLQGLNARPAIVSNLDVYHGYPDYLQINGSYLSLSFLLLFLAVGSFTRIEITAIASLYNPSNITIVTGDVSFTLTFQGAVIGSAQITALTLVPGVNAVPTAVHYQPSAATQANGEVLLENFVQGILSETIIEGSATTTSIKSLQPALATIRLVADIPPLQQNLITQANLAFPLDIAQTYIADATFNLANPFTANINLLGVVASASYEGIALGVINVRLRISRLLCRRS